MTLLLQIWLHFTGGEQACPRGRFALTMLAAYALYHLLVPGFVHSFATLSQHGMPAEFAHPATIILFMGMVLALVSLLLAFLPFSPLALLGTEMRLYEAYELLRGAGSAASAAPVQLWPYWCGFLLSAFALLFAGSVVFGAAWRRLRDAGRSPFFLLLGLTYLLGFDSNGYAADSAGVFLLGPLWLIILYSQPSRIRPDFVIFRPLP